MTLVVMLIWVGLASGGPTTLAGFTSLAACERAISTVEKQFPHPWFTSAPTAVCVELSK